MIPLLAAARARIADALDVPRLARTVHLLSRQLDHAHLAGQIEEARADRAEAAAEHAEAAMRTIAGMLDTAGIGRRERDTTAVRLARMIADANTEAERTEKAEDRIEELERALADWRLQSGELVAEQAADDLPDLAPNDDSGPPSPLPADPYARAEVQAKRADALERHRLAAEAHAADLESELATTRAQLQQTERSAGAHLATIERLQEQIAAAHRAAHAPAPAEQIPGVAAADALTESERREGYQIGKQTGIGFAAGCQAIAESKARKKAAESADTPPETQPSARITATAGVQS